MKRYVAKKERECQSCVADWEHKIMAIINEYMAGPIVWEAKGGGKQ